MKRGTRSHLGTSMLATASACGALLVLISSCKGGGPTDSADAAPATSSSSSTPGTVAVGVPVQAWGMSWTVMDATDRGQLLPATNLGGAIKTSGRFVMVHFRVLNNGTTESSLSVPDLIDEKARRFKPHFDESDHVPPGAQTMYRQTLPPGIPREYWTIYDAAADAENLRVYFAGGVPRMDLGTLKAPEVAAAAASATAPTPAPAAQSLCADLDASTDYLVAAAIDIEHTMPAYREKNSAASGAGAMELFRISGQLERETATKGKDARDRADIMKAHVKAPGEDPILKDLLKGFGVTATAYERFSEAFHKGTDGFASLIRIDKQVAGLTDIAKNLRTDLSKRCEQLRP
jgi:hypothetical protein